MKDLFHQLAQGRRTLLSQTLTQEEAIKLRRNLVSILEAGNALQGQDMFVRHRDRGYLLGDATHKLSPGSQNSFSWPLVKVFRSHFVSLWINYHLNSTLTCLLPKRNWPLDYLKICN
jgi:hypothetical protein